MRKAILVALLGLATAGYALGQNATSPVDVLGAHNNNGRGCAGCHSPHSGAFGSGHAPKGSAADTGNYALWGQDASPLYGQTLAFGDNGSYVEVLPSSLTTNSDEVGGIMLCLSCHDGTVTATNMMTGHSYEQAIGLITNTAYGSSLIPTLLGNDGTTAGTGSSIASNYNNDHPVGLNALISTSGNGLTWTGTAFSVTAGTPYAAFWSNYGFPQLASNPWSGVFGSINAGKPYVACTTCHNQHVMTIYAGPSKPTNLGAIQQTAGGFYTTFFFINAPYDVNVQSSGLSGGTKAASTTQFCRQCHFGESNEANNTYGISTAF